MHSGGNLCHSRRPAARREGRKSISGRSSVFFTEWIPFPRASRSPRMTIVPMKKLDSRLRGNDKLGRNWIPAPRLREDKLRGNDKLGRNWIPAPHLREESRFGLGRISKVSWPA